MAFEIRTIEDLERFVFDRPPESVTLEYKNSRILQKSDTHAVCKAVSAFANSMGGTFIIGIDASGETLTLDGGCTGPSKIDWIHRVINSGTFPAVETIDVTEITADAGSYYVIDTKVSPKAPHQSQDHRYYRRRGSHSDPMEHYEIEDVRNRPKTVLAPLEISLFPEGQVVSFKLRNASSSEPIDNLSVEVDANFPFDRDSVARLKARGLKQMRPSVEHIYMIDSFHTILSSTAEPELQITASYEWRDHTERHSARFHLADYLHTSIVTPPLVGALNGLGKKLDTIKSALDKLGRAAEAWESATDGSGLRLSHRTIKALLKQEQRFDPREFDWQGYQVILDITIDEAIALHRLLAFGRGRDQRAEYNELPSLLREKFERVFRVDFGDTDS
ncbi:ATP-binding protein [Rhizobium sp. YK2]|uniref:AlbA family DNA-binding domain-containing protein n=1 Tax=Rhizobium sp. YK2 TaxID=1860096 RepID=UPI00084BCF0C|nr:ATP-binding protein [Rhizobium sp. YK2]OEC93381.1 hypothetical protein A9Z06_09440 [Rhizobium sp. YK2]